VDSAIKELGISKATFYRVVGRVRSIKDGARLLELNKSKELGYVLSSKKSIAQLSNEYGISHSRVRSILDYKPGRLVSELDPHREAVLRHFPTAVARKVLDGVSRQRVHQLRKKAHEHKRTYPRPQAS
jgi:hypothetical protein